MTTYILIDASGQATVIPEDKIYEEAGRRFISGETFEIYRAEPMSFVQPAEGAAAPTRRAGGTPRKRGGTRKTTRKAGRRQATEAASGRVGRPKVNVGVCNVPGCNKPQKTRGLCSAHYQQHRRLMRQGAPGLLETLGLKGEGEEAPKATGGTRRKAKATKTRRKAKKATPAGRPARKKAGKKAAKKTTRKTAKKAAAKRPARKKAARRPTQGGRSEAPAPEAASAEQTKSAE